MESKKVQKKSTKFNLEKFEIAKLNNLQLIIGGGQDKKEDPIDTNHQNKNGNGGSSGDCNK